MNISPKKVATITYTLKLTSGQVVDQADETKPFAFVHGIGATLPEFDSNLNGLAKGEEFSFKIEAKDGYGEFTPNAVVDLPKDIFAEAPAEVMQVGQVVPMQDQQGNPLQGTIKEIGADKVKVDFNHPLAGQDLFFSGNVLDVRDATDSELEHGHAHGPEGHEH